MELSQYFHAVYYSPIKSTFIKETANNNLTTWSGLTETLIQKHLPPSIITVQGHMYQERQNLQSTKSTSVYSTSIERIKRNWQSFKQEDNQNNHWKRFCG